MSTVVKLSKADARRSLIRHHFAPCNSIVDAFQRLRSIQFDPIAPVGGNHDLVLQSRVPDYHLGDWENTAYEERRIFDGWCKQASLVPFEGWEARRLFHTRHSTRFDKIIADHAEAVQAILGEIQANGPLAPADCSVKERKEEWKGHWHGPNVAKQVLRALWHTGRVMTAGRRRGHHLYDLAKRVVPPAIYRKPALSHEERTRQLFLDRHHAIGILRPTASYEVWSYFYAPERVEAIESLKSDGAVVPIEVEGVKGHATPDFLKHLDEPSLPKEVRFVAPLDQLMWDRKLVQHVFGFDYIWEIYVPESKRKWGYYVLPILFGDELVARIEFHCRNGVLEVRQWYEERELGTDFWEAFEPALKRFMSYCSAERVEVLGHIEGKVRKLIESA